MNKNYTETIVGSIVIAVAVYFAFFAYAGSNLESKNADGYLLMVNFDRIDGLNVGGEVKISGITVGSIKKAEIDTITYQANVSLNIDNKIKIPDDSSAEIISGGLLGDKYIALVPGGSEKYLSEGERIKFSQSSVSLEALIGKFMFSGASDEDEEAENGGF